MTVTEQYSQSITLNGSGYGYVRFAPASWDWILTRVNVSVSTQTLEAIASLYERVISSGTRIDSTERGSSGDTFSIRTFISDGTSLYAEWTGGDAGATATATITVERRSV